MTLTRRRFLTISAALAWAPKEAAAAQWQGRAFGADISLTIRGGEEAKAALEEARTLIKQIEALFSLYDPESALVRLNQTGELSAPDPQFIALMQAADDAYQLTRGLFDPTVQRLWQTIEQGRQPQDHIRTIGWDRVQFDANRILLGHGQALTFNGIAQGYATDKITEVLHAHGLRDVLVNIGEHRALGGPWRLSLSDPDHGALGTRTLTTGALATSSPNATPFGASGHILHHTRQPQWSTISVEASSATLADSLSTAMVLANLDEIEAIRNEADVSRVTLVNWDGDLTTL
ncbi:MAG: FAD:protein FMN transferase [Paracoccaceae bacterium]